MAFLMYLGNHFLYSCTDDLSFNLFDGTFDLFNLLLALEELLNVGTPCTSPLAQLLLSRELLNFSFTPK